MRNAVAARRFDASKRGFAGMVALASGSGLPNLLCQFAHEQCVRSIILFVRKTKKHAGACYFVFNWCPEEDSNLHTLRHTDLNRARLPIPPPGHLLQYCVRGAHFIEKGKIVNEKEKKFTFA